MYLVSEHLDRTPAEGGVVCRDSAASLTGLADLDIIRQAVPHHVETQIGKEQANKTGKSCHSGKIGVEIGKEKLTIFRMSIITSTIVLITRVDGFLLLSHLAVLGRRI